MKNIYTIVLALVVVTFFNAKSMSQLNNVESEQDHLDKKLFQSILEGSVDKVRQALANGANANAETKRGWDLSAGGRSSIAAGISALRTAIAIERFNPEIIKLLLEHGADINKKEDFPLLFLILNQLGSMNRYKPTTVEGHKEFEKAYKGLLKKLLFLVSIFSVDLGITNREGKTLLEYAKQLDLPDAYRILNLGSITRKGLERFFKENLITEHNIPSELIDEILKQSRY